jgi:predicted Zn-dependent peptidase
MLTYYQTIAGDWRYLVTYDREVATITPEEVMAVARAYFVPANRVVVTLDKGGVR